MEWANGLEIEKGKLAFAEARIVEYEGGNTVLEVILYQGLNRQIRRMCNALDYHVVFLKRIKFKSIKNR